MLFVVTERDGAVVLRLDSRDGTNRLSLRAVVSLTHAVARIAEQQPAALIITGNEHFFSAGADLNEITGLTGPSAYEFGLCGQRLMNAISALPFPVIAAVRGYCIGGGLDLALACHRRFAAPNAVFGHRGAALGLITGWGGTQRLPRLVGKARALQMFLCAEKLHAAQALEIGLVSEVAEDPVEMAMRYVNSRRTAVPRGSGMELAARE
jgi:enoyl-CoA hydratase